jgi:hypothetical protein
MDSVGTAVSVSRELKISPIKQHLTKEMQLRHCSLDFGGEKLCAEVGFHCGDGHEHLAIAF